MFFRINGAAIWTRGANLIPMEEHEGKISAEAYKILVNTAENSNFNVLRIWGGGIYPPDIFYDMCDESGIMVY